MKNHKVISPCGFCSWSWWSELNRQPAVYDTAALPLSHTSIYMRTGFPTLFSLVATVILLQNIDGIKHLIISKKVA
jgi:hypothetical protein